MSVQQRIIHQARTWLGTRWKHQGRIKKSSSSLGGADCLGVLIGASDELNLTFDYKGKKRKFSDLDTVRYGRIPPQKVLIGIFAELFDIVPLADVKIGDIVLTSIGSNVQHVALITDHPNGLGVLHSNAGSRKCVEHILTSSFGKEIKYCFRFKKGVC